MFSYSLRRTRPRRLVRLYSTPKLNDIGFWEYTGEVVGSGVTLMQTGMETMHGMGLPWWTTILAATAIIRTAVLPARIWTIYQQSLMQRAHQDVTGEVPILRLRHKTKPALRVAVGIAWLAALRRHGTHPLRSLTPILLHVPLFVGMGAALRRMGAFPWWGADGEVPVAGWDTGLFGYDLGVTFPLLTAVVVASNVGSVWWLFRDRRGKRWIYWLLQTANVFSAIILSMLPASINFFVLANNSLMIIESTLLRKINLFKLYAGPDWDFYDQSQ